jgi:hypothetical protein
MGIESSADGALTETQMTGSAENVMGSWRYERLTSPGHWMLIDPSSLTLTGTLCDPERTARAEIPRMARAPLTERGIRPARRPRGRCMLPLR